MRTLSVMYLLAATAAGCGIDDADLENGALASFTLTPAATTTDRFTMAYTGSVTSGFTSAQPATLTVKVDGQPVVEQAIDLSSSLTQAIQITVPLAAEGPNAVSAEMAYQGATLSQDSVITVAMTAPMFTFPTFTQTLNAQGLTAAGTIMVAPAAGYTVDEVAVSADAGPWVPAVSDNAGGWVATMINPDIGDVDVAVRAQVSIDGHAEATIAHKTMHVNPIFNCTTPAASMLPSTELIRNQNNNGQEVRVMTGYFGQPDQGHDVTFTILARPDINNVPTDITLVGETLRYGYTDILVGYPTARLDCGNNPCTRGYDLRVLIDGVEHCKTALRTTTGTPPSNDTAGFGFWREFP